MTATAYADLDTYNLLVPGDTGTDEQKTAAILIASRQVDRYCGRTFGLDEVDVTRVYRTRGTLASLPYGWAESENPFRYGGWTRHLDIDDLVTVTTIKIDNARDGSFSDETALATTDYELWPLNAALDPEPAPYQQVYIPDYSTIGGFPPATSIQIVGRWGWPAIPQPVVDVTCQLAGLRRLALDPAVAGLRSLEATTTGTRISYGGSGGGSGGSVDLSPLHRDMLAQYRRGTAII